MNYIPLNVETYYSFLSSAISIDDYIKEAKKLSLNVLGICDNNPYAFAEFSSACIANDIKPILGSRFKYKFQDLEYEICVFIPDEKAYSSYCLLYKNIIDNTYQGDFKNLDHLIFVIDSTYYTHKDFIEYLKTKVSHLYIGLSCYCQEDILKNKQIINASKKYGIMTIPFPRVKAISKHDGLTLKILDAIKNDKVLSSQDEETTPYFLLSNKSIETLYEKECIDNLDYFYQSSFNLMQKRGSLPSFNIENKKEYVYNLAYEGLKNKNLTSADYISRLEYEIDVVSKMGYLDYFLCVSYYVKTAKKNNIVVGPGRGSAAGSLLSYALNITEIDPLKYNLIFERFLNPERITLPDIDVDFADYQRDDVIKLIIDKFQESRVKQIIAFQTFKAKQAIRDIGRVFNYNATDINLLCKSLNQCDSFKKAYKEAPAFSKLLESQHYKKIIDLASKIEGFPHQKSLHAAGVIINHYPLNEVLPISGDLNTPVPFEANYLEELGFLKMDILSLKNLTLIESIIKEINKKDPNFNLSKIDLNNQKTFDILNMGFTKSIFQLESDGMTSALKLVHIDSFDDLICLNALYRPGPMDNIKLYAKRKANKEDVKYVSSQLEPILKDTYGIIVYQEQIMQIARTISNFTYAKADLLRRAISKKDEAKLETLKNDFVNGALNNNYSLKEAEELYEYILKFANYGFNKAHSVAYSLISYQMAYLKANYPQEFFAVILNNLKGSDNRFLNLLNELDYFQIKLLLPSINESTYDYKIEGNNLRLPLGEIKGINTNIERKIIEERNNGTYKDYIDFIRRIYDFHFDNSLIINLINAGALDCFKLTRTSLKNSLNTCLLFAQNFPMISNFSSFEIDALKPVIKEYQDDIEQKNALEIECLSILISGNLFEKYQDYISKNNVSSISDAMMNKNTTLSMICKVASIKEINTRNNEKMGLIYCFDNINQIKVIAFPKTFIILPKINKNDVLIINGYLNEDDKGISFIANKIIKMEDVYE